MLSKRTQGTLSRTAWAEPPHASDKNEQGCTQDNDATTAAVLVDDSIVLRTYVQQPTAAMNIIIYSLV